MAAHIEKQVAVSAGKLVSSPTPVFKIAGIAVQEDQVRPLPKLFEVEGIYR
jgi:hypothetical protein